MLDRAAAQRAGLGLVWQEHQHTYFKHGSWVFLGQVVTDLILEPDQPVKKSCGSCVRCIVACPTQAIVAPNVIDNKRCISHLTIENRGSIPMEFRAQMSDWIFGCDICQDVCPVNVKASTRVSRPSRVSGFTTLELLDILAMTQEEFSRRFSGSPIKRAKLVGLKRNACVALGNSGDPKAVPPLIKALGEGEPLVREHAAWALGRLGGREAETALRSALTGEGDTDLRREMKRPWPLLHRPAASLDVPQP